jgi:protein CMS1
MPLPPLTGGDELEDDFVPDTLVALSGDESDGSAVDLEGAASDATEGNVTSASTSIEALKKRKRHEKTRERKAKVCMHVPYEPNDRGLGSF